MAQCWWISDNSAEQEVADRILNNFHQRFVERSWLCSVQDWNGASNRFHWLISLFSFCVLVNLDFFDHLFVFITCIMMFSYPCQCPSICWSTPYLASNLNPNRGFCQPSFRGCSYPWQFINYTGRLVIASDGPQRHHSYDHAVSVTHLTSGEIPFGIMIRTVYHDPRDSAVCPHR